MANTYTLIQTATVGSGGIANIEFVSIPQTYTDLQILVSLRSNTGTGDDVLIRFNGLSTNLSSRTLYGTGSATGSSSYPTGPALINYTAATSATASVFGNGSIYIPNYSGNTNKSISGDGVAENNATASVQMLAAGLWSETAAITQINILPNAGTLWVEHSSASLYGIKNS